MIHGVKFSRGIKEDNEEEVSIEFDNYVFTGISLSVKLCGKKSNAI